MKTDRHIVHVVPAPFDAKTGVIGGAERYAYELARHMAAAAPTTLVSFGDADSEETRGNLKVRVLGNAHYVRGQRTNPVSAKLLSAIAHADVVHCHQQHVVASSFAAAACRISGRKVFVSDLGGGGWDVSGYVSTDRWYHGHLHISEYSRSLSSAQATDRSHVILGGVDTEHFFPIPFPEQTGPVLFVGRLLPHKGVNDLIAGLPQGMPLEVIGRVHQQQHFADLQALAAGKAVTFRHSCDDRDLVRAYQKAMCMVLPSVYKDMYGAETRVPELLGQTLLEGMACGIPAICTAVASMPEIVEDGVTGFVVPPNNPAALREKLRWLRDHPAQRRAMGAAARQRVLKTFTWPRVVERCMEIYDR